jgi:hypothetical protein
VTQRWRLPAALAFIALATLLPIGSAPPRWDNQLDLADAIVNIALFLPLGLLLERDGWRGTNIMLLALAVSFAIEILQGSLIPGRRGSALDVAFNLAGAGAGFLGRRTPSAVLALPLLPWIASGALLRPSAPKTPTWWGQWAHAFAGTSAFEGRILSLRLLDQTVPDGPIDSTAGLAARAERSGLSLDVELLAGSGTDGLTHLAGVSDGEGHVIIALEQSGSDLILTWRSLGASLGLRPPRALFPAFLPLEAGERVRLSAEVRAGHASVAADAPGLSGRRALRFTPMSGWRNFIDVPSPHPRWPRLLTALWTALGIGYAVSVLLVVIRRRTTRVS